MGQTIHRTKHCRPWATILMLPTLALCVSNSPPSLSGRPVSRVTTQLGRNTKLTCPVQSDHELTQWKKDGLSINTGWDRFKVSRDGHLRITATEASDAGLYTCIATNGFGSININYTLLILDSENNMVQEADQNQEPIEDRETDGSAPYFEDLDKMKEFIHLVKPRGSTVRLTCRAAGNPTPELTWFRHSLPQAQGRVQSTLKIPDMTEADSGPYTCLASNRLGQVNFTFNLEVIDEIRHKPRLIAPHPLNQTVPAGSTVSFQCHIESVVTPEVQWLKRVDRPGDVPSPKVSLVKYQQQEFLVLRQNGLMMTRPDGSFLHKLVLQHTRPSDTGMYVCLATNRRGFNTRHAFLHVTLGGSSAQGANFSLFKEDSQGGVPFSSSALDKGVLQGSTTDDSHLPMLIGLPSCLVLVLILVTIFLVQRRNSCCRSAAPTNKVLRPVLDRGNNSYKSTQPTSPTAHTLLASPEQWPTRSASSVAMTNSEFSSVSRAAPQYFHANQNHLDC